MPGIEFNGDVRFNRADLNGGLKKGIKSDNSTNIDIGKLLGSSNKTENIRMEDLLSGKVKLGGEPTPEEKEAKAQLDTKVSSTGMSYADAENKINEIREKYNGDEYKKDVLADAGVYGVMRTIKQFDPSKLPEPARTEYSEAMESKNEIENNNAALAKKAGITPQENKVGNKSIDNNGLLGNIGEGFGLGTSEPTEKQRVARAKLDTKISSTGVKYKDAKAVISQLTDKYKDDKNYQSTFNISSDDEYAVLKLQTKFDPFKLPEPDKSAYFEALESVIEIEDANSALQAQTGLPAAAMPSQNYAELTEKFKDVMLNTDVSERLEEKFNRFTN